MSRSSFSALTQPQHRSPNKRSYDESFSSSQPHKPPPASSLNFTRPYSIYRITVSNFMIYTHHTVYLGPHLNLILGPNGSGKSTLVCAICLCLGGSLHSIGRAEKVGDFVKKGTRGAVIEVELFAAGSATDNAEELLHPLQQPRRRNLIVRRELDIDNQSQFSLGEVRSDRLGNKRTHWRDVSMKEVKEKMASFNIHVDNLCVLLAQDRVGAFAEMKATEVLIETEKAANMQYYDQHMELIRLRKEERKADQFIAEKQRRLSQRKQELEAMEPEMKRRAEREDIVEKVSLLKKKRLWTEYRSEEKKGQTLFNQMKDAEEKVEVERKKQQPLLSAFSHSKQQSKIWKRKQEKQEELIRSLNTKRKVLLDQLHTQAGVVLTKRQEMIQLQEEATRYAQTVRLAEQRVHQQEQKCAELTNENEIDQQLSVARQEYNSIRTQSTALDVEIRSKQSEIADVQRQIQLQEQKLNERASLSQRRMEAVFRRVGDRRLRSDYELVEKAKQRQRQYRAKLNADPTFIHDVEERKAMNNPHSAGEKYVLKGEVFGPLVLEVEFQDKQVGMILENLVSFERKFTYIVSNRDDWIWLTTRVRMVAHNDGREVADLTPQALRQRPDLSQYAALGVVGYVNDAIQAPSLVMNWLCTEQKLTRIPYTHRELTGREVDSLFPATAPIGYDRAEREGGAAAGQYLQSIYTPTTLHMVKFSRYGQHDRILTERYLKPAELFLAKPSSSSSSGADAMDGDEKQAILSLRTQLKIDDDELTVLNKQRADFNKLHSDNATLRNQLERGKDEYKRAFALLKKYQDEYKHKKNQHQTQASINLLQAEIYNINHNSRVKKCKEFVAIEETWIQEQCMLDAILLTTRQKLDERSFLDRTSNSLSSALKRLEVERDKQKQMYQEHLTRLARLSAIAAECCEEQEVMGLGWVTDNVELLELDELINDYESSIELMRSGDDLALQQRFDRLQNEVNTLTQELLQATDLQQQSVSVIQSLKQEWLAAVRHLVQQINTRFAVYFQRFLCTGRVSLFECDEYEQYAIRIEVSFREGDEVRLLNSQSQSGGEKSVTTMLYLLCLQHVTNAPFRIVDEINQGMDEDNEKKVFNQIVYASCDQDVIQTQTTTTTTTDNNSIDQSDQENSIPDSNGLQLAINQANNHHEHLTPQYVVVTPKLLYGLDMPENAGLRVLTVFAGQFASAADGDADRDDREVPEEEGWERIEQSIQYAQEWKRHRANSHGTHAITV